LSAAYAAVNPNKRIPAIEDEGFILWESNAITQYLASRKPEAGLLPLDERARALVNQWQFWDISSWDPACATIVFERLVKKMLGMGEPDPAKVQEGEQNFHRYAQILNDTQGAEVCDRQHPDPGRFLAGCVAEHGPTGTVSAGAVRGNQTVACVADGIARMAKGAGASICE